MAKKKSSGSFMSIFISGFSITRNGKTIRNREVNYERTEHPDGTVTERGRPAGLKPGASIGEAIRAAFGKKP